MAYKNRLICNAGVIRRNTFAHEFLHVLLNGSHDTTHKDFMQEFDDMGKEVVVRRPSD